MAAEIIATPSITKKIIKKNNLKLNKGMGQSFLIDQNIVGKIIDASVIKPDDVIIEIGPGIGSLTQFLLKEIGEGKYIGLEKDRKLVAVLRELFTGYKHAEFLNRDVLDINWPELLKHYNLEGKNIKIIANLPYYITTPIIIKLLETEYRWARMVFMVQKEVAERMVASPGGKTYGSLSIIVQFYSNPEIIYNVSPAVFIPRPEVYSSLITLKPHKKVPYVVKDKKLFFNIVRGIFQQRRKKIKNSLLKASTLNFKREEIVKGLKESNINPGIRGEKLDIAKFVQLSNILYEIKYK